MRVHHLNCGYMRPIGGPIFDGFSRGPTACLICHCLLIETDQGLVLVDTGFGIRDVATPGRRLSGFFRALNNIELDERWTALRQIEALGHSARDVRHIVMTHLDFDHAGGLEDFPEAIVHVTEAELDAAWRQDGPLARRRYSIEQLDEVKNWAAYRPGGERWFGFEAVRGLRGLGPEILMVSLPGHTEGHVGVAIKAGHGWLVHAGDTYFYRHEMDRPERESTPGARGFQLMIAADHGLHLYNQERLREVYQDPDSGLTVFCTHDAIEFEALALIEARRAREGFPGQAAANSRAGWRRERAMV